MKIFIAVLLLAATIARSQGAELPGQRYEGLYARHTINTNILDYCKANGEAVVGKPVDNGSSIYVHYLSGGNYSVRAQDFAGGSHGPLTIFESGTNASEVNDLHGFRTYYFAHGSIATLGPPRENEHAITTGFAQRFADSTLLWSAASGTVTNVPAR